MLGLREAGGERAVQRQAGWALQGPTWGAREFRVCSSRSGNPLEGSKEGSGIIPSQCLKEHTGHCVENKFSKLDR